MLKPLFGSETREKVLVFILARDKGYPTEIARFFDTGLNQVQRQLENLEAGGVLVSLTAGRTRIYEFNPRCTFLKELKSLLEKAFSFYPNEVRWNLTLNRRRPRSRNKPL